MNPVFLHCLSLAISWRSNVVLRSQRECQRQGRPWLTRGPVRGMEWGPPRSVCNGVTGGGGGGVRFRSSRGAGPGATAPVAPPKGRPWSAGSVYIKLTRERRQLSRDSLPISNTEWNFMVLSEANQNQLLFSSSEESRKSLSHCSPFVEVTPAVIGLNGCSYRLI